MKTTMKIILGLMLAALLTGCGDPTKTGGGGKQQSYDPGNGQYNK